MEKGLYLYIHSIYSVNGENAIEVLVDHNTTHGVLATKKAAEELGMTSFTALEIDGTHEKENFYFLRYGIHLDAHKVYEQLMQKIKERGGEVFGCRQMQ